MFNLIIKRKPAMIFIILMTIFLSIADSTPTKSNKKGVLLLEITGDLKKENIHYKYSTDVFNKLKSCLPPGTSLKYASQLSPADSVIGTVIFSVKAFEYGRLIDRTGDIDTYSLCVKYYIILKTILNDKNTVCNWNFDINSESLDTEPDYLSYAIWSKVPQLILMDYKNSKIEALSFSIGFYNHIQSIYISRPTLDEKGQKKKHGFNFQFGWLLVNKFNNNLGFNINMGAQYVSGYEFKLDNYYELTAEIANASLDFGPTYDVSLNNFLTFLLYSNIEISSSSLSVMNKYKEFDDVKVSEKSLQLFFSPGISIFPFYNRIRKYVGPYFDITMKIPLTKNSIETNFNDTNFIYKYNDDKYFLQFNFGIIWTSIIK